MSQACWWNLTFQTMWVSLGISTSLTTRQLHTESGGLKTQGKAEMSWKKKKNPDRDNAPSLARCRHDHERYCHLDPRIFITCWQWLLCFWLSRSECQWDAVSPRTGHFAEVHWFWQTNGLSGETHYPIRQVTYSIWDNFAARAYWTIQ